jgi:hypothetical protein
MNRLKACEPGSSLSELWRASAGFDGKYGLYKELLAEMDHVEGIEGKKNLFRQLFGLLDNMEGDLWCNRPKRHK